MEGENVKGWGDPREVSLLSAPRASKITGRDLPENLSKWQKKKKAGREIGAK